MGCGHARLILIIHLQYAFDVKAPEGFSPEKGGHSYMMAIISVSQELYGSWLQEVLLDKVLVDTLES